MLNTNNLIEKTVVVMLALGFLQAVSVSAYWHTLFTITAYLILVAIGSFFETRKLKKELDGLETSFKEFMKAIDEEVERRKNPIIKTDGRPITTEKKFDGDIVVPKDFTNKKRGWRANWKLTEAQKEAIKNDTRSQEKIAKDYKISRSYVGQIKRGKK